MNEKIESIFNGKDIYIVGAGRNGNILGQYFNQKGIKWNGYIDKEIRCKELNGKHVITYFDIKKGNQLYLISSIGSKLEMEQELFRRNISSDNIVEIYNTKIWEDALKAVISYESLGEKIKSFKDKYKGQRCFIIGNGPSLKMEDLESLKNEKTFASNSIYLLYEYLQWRPTFYCASDPIMTNNILLKDIEKVINDSKYVFTSANSKMIQYAHCYENIFYTLLLYSINQENGLPMFSLECDQKVYLSGTVTYQMIQLAIYMGFQEIYLLGMDCSYAIEKHEDGRVEKKNIASHHSILEADDKKKEENGEIEVCWADIDKQINGYKSARLQAEKSGVSIYNATRGGKLEVFERVKFDSLFNRKESIDNE